LHQPGAVHACLRARARLINAPHNTQPNANVSRGKGVAVWTPASGNIGAGVAVGVTASSGVGCGPGSSVDGGNVGVTVGVTVGVAVAVGVGDGVGVIPAATGFVCNHAPNNTHTKVSNNTVLNKPACGFIKSLPCVGYDKI